jgi:hypothetical protein
MAEIPRGWRWGLWSLYAAAWTVALLVPMPEHGRWDLATVEINKKFLLAKALHVTAYAVMAGLTGWLRAPLRLRFFLMFFLMAHGTVTEVLQYSVDFIGRSGGLFDVGLDHIGIALGTLATWRWWAKEG